MKPLTLAFWLTAKLAPCWVGSPLEASAPDVGRLLTMMISPLLVSLPVPPVPPPPQASDRSAALAITPPPLRIRW